MVETKSKWHIEIDQLSKKPKYLQIVESVMNGIQDGKFQAESRLPSVNTLLRRHDISRDTIVKAYNKLKRMNVIESVPGKGYYVKGTATKSTKKILLIFNKLSQHKKIIYDSFVHHLGTNAQVDFYIYNNDYRLFESLLEPRLEENYHYFVIIGHFLEGGLNAIDILNEIPKNKLLILDKNIKGIRGSYASVYQDFESDIFRVLNEATTRLQKYQRLKLIFPYYTYQPKEIVSGFIRYCSELNVDFEVIKELNSYQIEKGTAYVVTMEDDLVTLIKKQKSAHLEAGKDIGIISYNETPLKEILLDGITTISTDFAQLGKTAAELVTSGDKLNVKNPFHIKFRNSL
ncbi:GntR family transcriptional regulator [Portibacter marinus]|uniref:GntR family transcriptional regulator n=1 Tax=Portibacter marinus TaxID=2898660 RepID=UPI001F277BAA|nr:GntR family transcriptional regulator [Portibacter marinus]